MLKGDEKNEEMYETNGREKESNAPGNSLLDGKRYCTDGSRNDHERDRKNGAARQGSSRR